MEHTFISMFDENELENPQMGGRAANRAQSLENLMNLPSRYEREDNPFEDGLNLPGLGELVIEDDSQIDEAVLAAGEEPEEINVEQLQAEADDLKDIDTSDMVKLYIKEATRVPLLTAQEEIHLAQRIEHGRLAQNELGRGNVSPNRLKELRKIIVDGNEAREHIIRANALLVISVAKKYIGRGVTFLDLIQEGNIGLMRAAKKYDYQRGFRFSTYATWWIRQAVTRALSDQSRTIRLPAYMSEQINRMLREQHALQQKLGRAPSREELAERMGMTPAKIEDMTRSIRQPLSLQMTINEDEDDTLGEFIEDTTIPNPESTAIQTLLASDLNAFLKELPPRELKVLQMRYGLLDGEALTLQEVGRRMGISRERARQIEAQALARLRSPGAVKKLRPYAE